MIKLKPTINDTNPSISEEKSEKEIAYEKAYEESRREVAKNKKKTLVVVLIMLALLAGYFHYFGKPVSEDTRACKLVISCLDAYNNKDLFEKDIAKQIPRRGRMVTGSFFIVTEGDTIKDLLETYSEKNDVEIVFEGKTLVKVDFLSRGDGGSNSYWTYTVNGQAVNKDITDYLIEDGDVITLEYRIDS